MGVDQGNQLNQEVVFSMGKIEARQVLNALNIEKEKIVSIADFMEIANTMMDVLFPPVMKFDFFALSEKEGVARVEKCFIWEEVKKSKGESEYVCACNARHRGWLAAIGVNGRIEKIKFIPDGDDVCEFRFVLESKEKYPNEENKILMKAREKHR